MGKGEVKVIRIELDFTTNGVGGYSANLTNSNSMTRIVAAILPLIWLFPYVAALGDDLPILGRHEKIRMAWGQYGHFEQAGVSHEELVQNLKAVGFNVLVGHTDRDGNKLGKLAHQHGIRYYAGVYTATSYWRGKEWKIRLAVDQQGLTCPDHWARKDAGNFGNDKPAYVSCPLDRKLWEKLFAPHLPAIREGWLDGIHLDVEAYDAYSFDWPGAGLCYCDDCFGKYVELKQPGTVVPPEERYVWLTEHALLEEYLLGLQQRLTKLIRDIATEIRQIHPTFGFSCYPDWIPDQPTTSWRMQAIALGLHHPDAPFIVVNSTPYWENHNRPWWDSPHEAYKAMGLKHILGSWDGGLMGHHPELQVGAAQAMAELAMASDGYWRWSERQFTADDWHSLASAHQQVRQLETQLGTFLFEGKRVPHFATLVEQKGNPQADRTLVARTWEHDGKYLTRVCNTDADQPMTVRVRFSQIDGDGQWRLQDPIHHVRYDQYDGSKQWDTEALESGIVIALEGRHDLYLLLEPDDTFVKEGNSDDERFQSVRSLEVRPHRSRPAAPPPVPVTLRRLMADDFHSDLQHWDTSRVDPARDGHRVEINQQGQLTIDCGPDQGNGRGFLLTRKKIPSSRELATQASAGDILLRIEYDVISASKKTSGGLLVGVQLDGDDAGGTHILDTLATTSSGWKVPWSTWPPGVPYFNSTRAAIGTGLSYITTYGHAPNGRIRVEWLAGIGETCTTLRVFVNGKLDGTIVDPTGKRLEFAAGPVGFWLLQERDVVIDNFSVWCLEQSSADTDETPQKTGIVTSSAVGDDSLQHATASDVVFTSTVYGDQVGLYGQNLFQTVHTSLSLANVSEGTSRPLFKIPGYCRDPVFSPDRETIAAAVWVNGRGQIYLIDTRTGRGWNVSHNPYCDRSPVFSSDGQRIAFVSDRNGSWDVFVMEVDGSEPRPLTTSPANDLAPTFSPDGQHIALISDRAGDYDVFIVPVDGGPLRRLAPQSGSNEYDPVWSPDGSWIAWTAQSRQLRRIVVARPDGSGRRSLPQGVDGELGFDHGAPTDVSCLVASPDGTKLAGAFTDYYTAGVFVLDVATGRITKLVNEPPQTPYAADWYGTGTGSPRWILQIFSGVDIAPDNRSIVFCSNHRQGAAEFAANGWQPIRRSFALYAMPLPKQDATNKKPTEFINLYLPPEESKVGRTDANQGTMLPNTATSWPAQVSW
ncbi:MAG: hypothetical protein MK179_17175 [Pirellulaceae bacterium]|nr:hypothetical protein [Pirellulaceae bacterium]